MRNMTVTQITPREAGDEARRNIAANLRLLRRITNAKPQAIAEAVGMSKASLHAKMATRNPTPCTADQLAGLAAFFGVPVDVFYGPPEETIKRLPDLGVSLSTCSTRSAA